MAGIPLSFKSDSVVSYEAGLKGALKGLNATYEAAVFQIDWDDIQLLTTDTVSAVHLLYERLDRPQPRRRAVGALVAGSRPVDRRGDDLSGRQADRRPGLARRRLADLRRQGDRLPGSAKFSGSLSTEYDWSIGHGLSAFAGGSLAYVGGRYADFANILPTSTANAAYGARVKLPSYTTIDLRGGVYNDDWRLTVYVKNVGDKRGVIEATTRGGTSSPQAIFLQPRTVGVSASRSF